MSLNGAVRRSEQLWRELRDVLGGHIASGHDEVDTFNRLLRKRRKRFEPNLMLQLPDEGLRIRAEEWLLDALWSLLDHPSLIVNDEPNRPEGAVVVVRWDGRNFLMDGRRRINYWKRQGIVGPHRVLLIDKAPQ
jgi:hypothetical protein